MGSVCDGRYDDCVVEEAQVGRADAFDGVAEYFEAIDDRKAFGGKEVDMVHEGEFSVQVEAKPLDGLGWGDG